MKCGIYCIENKINEKKYIGQSTNIEERWYRHKLRYNEQSESDKPLYLAMKKYGIENFTFSILEECNRDLLNEREEFYILKFNSHQKDFGYNCNLGGSHASFQVINEEILEEIFNDLQNTELTNVEIGKKYGLSEFYISKINNGLHLRRNKEYPIRKRNQNFCIDCGIKIQAQSIRCQECHSKTLRKVERPSARILAQEIIDSNFTKVAKKYNVTDNAIRKWCVAYGIPKNKKDLKEWLSTQMDE